MAETKEINKKIILVILDGWGIAPPGPGNMVEQAHTPTFDALKEKYSYTELCASGECVGLMKNQPGNSEAGHLNLGAGRIVEDDSVTINKSIEDGTFFKNPSFHEGLRHLRKHHSKIHLMGLVTEGRSAHSCPEHWEAMLRFLAQQEVPRVYLHLFTDGRDSSQHAALKIIEKLRRKISFPHRTGRLTPYLKVEVASVIGRFYAMDRKKNWENIRKTYELLVFGQGLKAKDFKEAILSGYNRHETDEYLSGTVIVKDVSGPEGLRPVALIGENDVVIFMNLRSDRARELTKAFVQTDFVLKNPGAFQREKIKNLFFIALTDFGPDLDHTRTAYPSRDIKNSLPVWLNGIKQYYIAETEKYAHVTFFFNGGYDHPVAGEKREMVPSPDVPHYDLVPEMSAFKITNRLLEMMRQELPEFILVNFANPDMLGHTGNLEATRKGVETVDQCLGKVKEEAKEKNYVIIVTADHGNAEEKIDPLTREIKPFHTTNPVPFIIVSDKKYELMKGGTIGNVAPTIIDLMGIKKPEEMEESLIIH